MKYPVLFLCLFVLGCSSRQPLQEATAVIRSHEAFLKAGNLDSVLSNMTDDVVGVIPGMPMVKGKDAFRIYYATSFKSGRTDIAYDIQGAEAEGSAVIVHGFAEGTLTLPDTTMIPLAENFLMVLKEQPDGRLKLWRVASSPGAR